MNTNITKNNIQAFIKEIYPQECSSTCKCFLCIESFEEKWVTLAKEVIKLRDKRKYLEEKENIKFEKLKQLSNYTNYSCQGIVIGFSERKGSVDYSKIPELQGVDLDKYRKKPTTICNFIY